MRLPVLGSAKFEPAHHDAVGHSFTLPNALRAFESQHITRSSLKLLPSINYLSRRAMQPPSYSNAETSAARTAYTAISLFCMFVLASMLGTRVKAVRLTSIRGMTYLRTIVVLLYGFAISFVVSAAIVESGLGLETAPACRSAIFLCLGFYVISKILMYVFLIERAHSVRAPYLSRRGDWLWLFGMVFMFLGFGAIAIVAFVFPISGISAKDGKCRIGVPLKVTIPLLSFDCVINVALTGIFIYLLRPILRLGVSNSAPYWRKKFTEGCCKILGVKPYAPDDVHFINLSLMKSVERLVHRSTIGCALVLVPTLANMSLLFSMKGRELGWLCLTLCSLDVTWAVAVIHWLTADPSEADERPIDQPTSDNPMMRAAAPL